MHRTRPSRAVKQDLKLSFFGMRHTNLQQLKEILTDGGSGTLVLFVLHTNPYKAETVLELQLYKTVFCYSEMLTLEIKKKVKKFSKLTTFLAERMLKKNPTKNVEKKGPWDPSILLHVIPTQAVCNKEYIII